MHALKKVYCINETNNVILMCAGVEGLAYVWQCAEGFVQGL